MTSLQLAVSGRLPEPDLVAVLMSVGFPSNLVRWVDAHLEPGPYTHYTVSLQKRGSQSVLKIETFRLDPWINSKTGETGKSPHGSCEEFLVDAEGNVVNDGETVDADGTVSSWISRSVSFFGG